MIFSSCANQLPPSGGPIDKEPPVVTRTFPESGTLNYNKNFVEFEFNEFINKRNVINSIFVSPYFDEELELKWSGKKLRIIFPDKLKENKTYIVSLGTDISDLRGNKLAETVTLRFSTGNKIDDGIISGKVYDEKPDGIMIFFYLIDSVGQAVRYDSLRPDFVCQTSKDGSFSLPGLPDGIYRIIAVRDQMRNLVFDINEDEIGLPFKDYVLNDTVRTVDNAFFEMMRIDTIAPAVNSVKFEDLNHLRVNFSEEIDLSSVSLNNFSIQDTLNQFARILGWYSLDKNSIVVLCDDLIPDKDYTLQISGIRDKSGNEILKSQLNFFSEKILDTIPTNLKNFECNFSTNVMEYFNPVCSLYFNDFVSLDNFVNALSVEDTTGKKIKYQISRVDSSNFVLRFLDLKQREKILLKINLGELVDLAGNKKDTLITIKIETNSESDYGSISGIIKNRNLVDDLELEAKQVNGKKSYKIKVVDEKYQLKNILPGSYLMKLSLPSENSPKSVEGYSKPFVYFPDTIKVKSRWPTTDVNFDARNLVR